MLTAKQNMREVMLGGNPVRFVNQYEAIRLLPNPYTMYSRGRAQKGQPPSVNAWGVTNVFLENQHGQFPVHTKDKIVVQDIARWREYVKAPSLSFTDEQWGEAKALYDEVDGTQAYKAAMVAPGLFEQIHHLCEIANALSYYITNPTEIRDMIKYLTEWELALAEGICARLKPDAVFHHDDWGTERSTFLRPEMFAEFFLEPYKQIYGYYKSHGVQIAIHHSDSYAATLVPYMIEMGIDIWQGCMESNNVPALIEKYAGKITFMGDIDNKSVDFDGWTQEDCRFAARKACDRSGTKYFIPCITQGGPGSMYAGTYQALTEEIDKYSQEVFGIKESDITRLPLQIMFR